MYLSTLRVLLIHVYLRVRRCQLIHASVLRNVQSNFLNAHAKVSMREISPFVRGSNRAGIETMKDNLSLQLFRLKQLLK